MATSDYSISLGVYTLGQENDITFYRPSAEDTLTLSYQLGEASGQAELVQSYSDEAITVYRWTPPLTLCAQLPAASEGYGTLTMTAGHNGTTVVKDFPVRFAVPASSQPTGAVQVSLHNDNDALAAWGLCVKGQTTLSYSVQATPSAGASVSRCRFTFGAASAEGLTGTAEVTAAGTLTPGVTVWDSRDRSAVFYGQPITAYDYYLPVLRSAFAWRCDESGEEDEEGTYLRCQAQAECAALDGRNAVTMTVRFRPVGGSWSGAISLPNNTETQIAQGLDGSVSYEVEITARDSLGSCRTVTVTSSTARVTLHLRQGGGGAAFGKYAQSDALECAWDASFDGDMSVAGDVSVGGELQTQALTVGGKSLVDTVYPVGSIYMTLSSTAPSVLFGGTWQRVQGRYLLGADDQHTSGTLGGSFSYQIAVSELPMHSHPLPDSYSAYGSGGSLLSAAGGGDDTGAVVSRGSDLQAGAVNAAPMLGGIRSSAAGWTGDAGLNEPMTIVPPYLAVYIWRRTG